jgi:hypothetical protein
MSLPMRRSEFVMMKVIATATFLYVTSASHLEAQQRQLSAKSSPARGSLEGDVYLAIAAGLPVIVSSQVQAEARSAGAIFG